MRLALLFIALVLANAVRLVPQASQAQDNQPVAMAEAKDAQQ